MGFSRGPWACIKIHDDESLSFKGRWSVPQKYNNVKRCLMDEGHNTPYYVHPGVTSCIKILRVSIDSQI